MTPMDATSLQCPKCGGNIPDNSRGLFPLYRIHADYLCPHCETELAWGKPPLPGWRWLLCFSMLPPMLVSVDTLWKHWIGIQLTEPSAWFWLASFIPYLSVVMFLYALRFLAPWHLRVKNDPRKFFWAIEAEERRLRSQPGSKW
jgi:hypothetical protein